MDYEYMTNSIGNEKDNKYNMNLSLEVLESEEQ